MLTRFLCASALVTLAGAASYAGQSSGASGVFEWHPHNDEQPTRAESNTYRWVSKDTEDVRKNTHTRVITRDDEEETVLIFSPSSKGGTDALFRDGVKIIELRLDGDRVADLDVTVNGKPLNGSKAKVENDHIIIYSPDGKTIAEFMAPVGLGAKHEITWHAQASQDASPRRVARVRSSAPAADARELRTARVEAAPRRVIGITASTPGEALAAQLGVRADKVILVESVNDGMPAAKAGIKRFDIITKVEGSEPANLGRLTEVIQSKDASEPIRLTIMRGGKEQTVELRPVLEEEDVEFNVDFDFEFDEDNNMPFGGDNVFRLRGQAEQARVEEAMAVAREVIAAQQQRIHELQIHLEERMNSVGRELKQKLNDEQVTEEVRRAYQQALQEIREVDVKEQLERALAEVQIAMREADVEREVRSLPEIRFFERGQANGKGVVVAPTPPPAPQAPSPVRSIRGFPTASPDNARLEALEDRMARIEALLERIAANQDR